MSASSRHIAVVGSGPAGFFVAEAMLKQPGVSVDLFDRLHAPFGLVRYGVAPDHQKIKQVTQGFTRTAQDPRLRFFGNVHVGENISAAELSGLYDQVVYATGCEAPRNLGLEGESLGGVHSALGFVSWYNAHPDYANKQVELNVENVAVVGAGDVSMDVCRLLLSADEELAATDMPDYALSAFKQRRIKRIHVIVRRGPGEAGFAQKELSAIAERDNVRISCDSELLAGALAGELSRAQQRKLSYLQSIVLRHESDAADDSKVQLRFHFLRSPSAFQGDDKLRAVRLEKNQLTARGKSFSAVGTGEFEELDCELALLAVGYRGVPIEGLPFDERSGLVPNAEGRVLLEAGSPLAATYVVGWLKRGPQGVIGTNKADSRATADLMKADLEGLPQKPPPDPKPLLSDRGVQLVSFGEWEVLDKLERDRGNEAGKPREKFVTAAEALAALKRPC